MNVNSILSIILAIILVGGSFGQFNTVSVFGQNLSVTSDDSKSSKNEKTGQQEKTEKKQKELEQEKTEQQEKIGKKQKELEQEKTKLKLHRENLKEKQIEKSKEYEEKFNEIKEKYQNNTSQQPSNDTSQQPSNDTSQQPSNDTSQQPSPNVENFSFKSGKLEEKSFKKSKEIREKLAVNLEKLDSRTQSILEKVNDGSYLGVKIGDSNYPETYELVFDSIQASKIFDKSQPSSSLTGKMSFGAYDKNNSSLKLELLECHIIVDQTPFNCGFGKARTVSSGQSGVKDSLVIIAFLEDDVLKEIHTTLKIFLNADILIEKIENSQVSIIGPQSQISHMWFLNGTATLSKMISLTEEIQTGNNFINSTQNKISIED